jgi:hypothetical protein
MPFICGGDAIVVDYYIREKERRSETYINNLKPLLKKLLRLIWQMILYAVLRRLVSLINMHPLPRPPELCGSIAGIGGGAADGVVKYEDACCSRAVGEISMYKRYSLPAGRGGCSVGIGYLLTYLSKAVPPQDNTPL